MLLPLGENGEGYIGSLYCFSQLNVNLQFAQNFFVFCFKSKGYVVKMQNIIKNRWSLDSKFPRTECMARFA